LFCEREIARKDERRIEMSVGLARFPFVRDLDGIDFAAQMIAFGVGRRYFGSRQTEGGPVAAVHLRPKDRRGRVASGCSLIRTSVVMLRP
jgi:hypothetical protein